MVDVIISDHSISGWAPLREQFGFVPDPMILRSAEIFLNGLSGAAALDGSEWRLLEALRENTCGITEFFDLLVTCDRIPLINYQDTFDRNMAGFTSIESLLGDLIFSGMAQAADTPHQVQGKRSRMYPGFAGAERGAHPMTREYEEHVFRAALQDAAWNARLLLFDPTATARVASPHRVFA